MPRLPIVYTDEFPYHLVNRCNSQDFFRIPIEKCWDIFSDYLFMSEKFYGLRIHCFVLMSNHYHLVASTTGANISEVMAFLQTNVAKEINCLSGKTNHLFGKRYDPSLITSASHFANVINYVYQNPVRAGVVQNPASYRFSSLYGLIGQAPLYFSVVPPSNGLSYLIPAEIEDQVNWLESKLNDQDTLAIRNGLRRSKFAIPKNNSNQMPTLEQKNLSLLCAKESSQAP